MNKVFSKWFLGVVLNAAATLFLAFLFQFPAWIAIGALILLDGVPLLWKWNFIAHTRNVDEHYVLGFWVLVQCIFFVFCIPPVTKLVMSYLLPSPVLVIAGVFFYFTIVVSFASFRTLSTRNFLHEGNE